MCDCLRGNYPEKTEVRVQYLWHLIDLDESCHEVLELIELCLKAGTVSFYGLKNGISTFCESFIRQYLIADQLVCVVGPSPQFSTEYYVYNVHGYFHLFPSFHLRTFLAIYCSVVQL